jgi:hypothetical protein
MHGDNDYGTKLAAINWAKLDPLDAQAFYTLVVTVCRASRIECFCGAHITELDEMRVTSVPTQEPRAIVVGCSGCNAPTTGDPHSIDCRRERCASCGEAKSDHGACGKSDNFACNKFTDRTATAAPAPELPRKVEPGTTLTVGARYRITAISTDDSFPSHQVGDLLIGYPKNYGMPAGTVLVHWDGDGYWFAKGIGPSEGTYVTGLELVSDAAKELK